MRAADYGRLDGLTVKEGLDRFERGGSKVCMADGLDVVLREDRRAVLVLQFGEFERNAVPQDERVSLLTHLDGPFLGFDHDRVERPVELIVFHFLICVSCRFRFDCLGLCALLVDKPPKLVRSFQDADYGFEGRDDVRHMLVLGYGFGLSGGSGVVLLAGIDAIFDFHAQ